MLSKAAPLLELHYRPQRTNWRDLWNSFILWRQPWEDRLRLGQFMMPLHPAGRPLHAYLAEDTEKALLMDRLGFDELFIGEHFSAATEPYPSPLMFAASLLPRTEQLTFATGVINAPSVIRPWWRPRRRNSTT